MIISQEYMETYVINPIARRLAEIEKKIDIIFNELMNQGIPKPELEESKPKIKKVK